MCVSSAYSSDAMGVIGTILVSVIACYLLIIYSRGQIDVCYSHKNGLKCFVQIMFVSQHPACEKSMFTDSVLNDHLLCWIGNRQDDDDDDDRQDDVANIPVACPTPSSPVLHWNSEVVSVTSLPICGSDIL